MTLHISEAEVQQVLTMPMALEASKEISRKQSTGEVVNHPAAASSFLPEDFSTIWLPRISPPAFWP